jgi:hypothetical protein
MHGTLPATEEQALASLRDRPAVRLNATALAKQWGWTRGKVQRRIARWRRDGELPPAGRRRVADQAHSPAEDTDAPWAAPIVAPLTPEVVTQAPEMVAPASAAPVRPFGRYVGAGILAAVGVALAGVGMVETTAYAASVGGLMFASLAVCADALVLFMPAAIVALWRRRSPAAILAAALWLIGASVTLANLSGYVGSRDDYFRAGRETQSIERAVVLERLARLRHERDGISETRSVGALNVAIRNARRWDRPALREAVAVAQRRDAVDRELLAVEPRLPAIPQVATADPSASVLSEITATKISETDFRRVRLALLLALPLTGGFVLSIALSLLGPPPARTRESEK